MTRKPLAHYGMRGHRVSLWIEGDRIIAQWRVRGKRTKRSWPNTAANRSHAKAWAERFAELRKGQQSIDAVTTVELWERYAESEFPSLRPRSQKLYAEYWRRWEVFAASESIAEDLGPETMAKFRADLEEKHLAPSTIGQTLRTVKLVYGWGYRNRVLARNHVRDYRYKVAKEKRRESPAEYRAEDFAALLKHLPLDGATTWRAHGVLALCGYQGVRQNAVLHLQWSDVDFDQRTVTWKPEWDKLGRRWTQPLRTPALYVLRAIEAKGIVSPWVFPSGSRKSQKPVYTAQSLWSALRGAETAAGIEHSARRGAHGLRRMLFNDVMEATGNPGTAMAAIGDTDLRVASRYLKTRDDRLVKAFESLDRSSTETAPERTFAEDEKTETAIPQGDSRPVYHAPRRNRTYNLPVEMVGVDGLKPGETPAYLRETPPESPEPPPKTVPKEHPKSTDDFSRRTVDP